MLVLLVGLLLTGCGSDTAPIEPTAAISILPSDTPTSTPVTSPTPEASPTPEFTPTPTVNYVGGVVEASGWVRYTSHTAGISIALPLDWRCINMDSDLYEASLSEARASLNPVPDTFERIVDMFGIDRSFRIYCFIPDTVAVEKQAHTKLYVQEFTQIGYTSAVKIMEERPVGDECQPVAESIDGRDAAMTQCSMTLQLRTTMTFHRRVDYILDGERFIALDFMGLNEDLLELYGKMAETVTFAE